MTWTRARVGRFVKYGLAAPVLARVIRHTNLANGARTAPPALINYSGGGDFVGLARHLSARVTQVLDLAPNDRLLDIGCGIGRVPTGLIASHPDLSYRGFDPVAFGIEWCRRRFAPHPSYGFDHLDLHNRFYNPWGRICPENLRFPYGDDSFDCAIALSVFTHLLDTTTARYVGETMRVLRPGGRAMFTTFLSDGPQPGRDAQFSFAHTDGPCRIESPEEPELAVAYTTDHWTDLARTAGGRVTQVIHGSWRGGPPRPDFQDVIVLQRNA